MAALRPIRPEKKYDLHKLSKEYKMRSLDEMEGVTENIEEQKGLGEGKFKLDILSERQNEENKTDLHTLAKEYKMRSFDE